MRTLRICSEIVPARHLFAELNSRAVVGAVEETLANLVERSYTVVLEPEDQGGFSVHVPALRGAHTQGETVEECLVNARDVIALHLEVLAERGEAIPPSDFAAAVAVSVPISAA